MGDTVSNEKKTICTKGSSHTAVQTAPDMCKLPNLTIQGFENTVPTERATLNVTVITLIQDKAIVTKGTFIGPLSDAAHEGVLGGSHGQYRLEATATDWSKDLFTEGMPVVRTKDPTTQNQGNTKGIIKAGNHTASAESIEDQMKKKCVITEFTGSCGHGRTLGWPGEKSSAEPFYLEVLQTDTITFTAVRKDISQKPNAVEPECLQGGEHTKWEARAVQHPLQTEETLDGNGTTFKVPAIMALNTIILKLLGYKAGEDQGHKEEMKHDTAREQPEVKPDFKAQREAAHALTDPAERDAAVKKVHQESKAWDQDRGRAARMNPKWSDYKLDKSVGDAIKVNSREIITFWLWRAAPPTIKVKALSCGATRNAEIKVFPEKKWEFELKFEKTKDTAAPSRREEKAAAKAADHFDQIGAALTGIKKVAHVAQKIVTLAGQKLEVEFLVGFHIKFEIKYVECTETKGYFKNSQYTPARVGRDWQLIIGAKPLIGVDAAINVPLINFVVPCIGQTVGDLLRRFKIVRADLVFSAKIGVFVNVQFGKDHYDFPKYPSAELGIDCTLAMALVIGAAGFDILEVKIAFPAVFKITFATSEKAGVLVQGTPSGAIQTNISITFFPDRWWGFEAGYWEPEMLKASFEGKPWDLLTAPG
jgi:hypothetical protein